MLFSPFAIIHKHTHTVLMEGAQKSVLRPLPFVTRTDLYDEHWISKQQQGVYLNINHTLTVHNVYIMCSAVTQTVHTRAHTHNIHCTH